MTVPTPTPETPRRWSRREVTAWGFIFGFHFFLAIGLSLRHSNIPDEEAYQQLAVNIVEQQSYHTNFTHLFQKAGTPQTHFAPGWPAALTLGYLLFGTFGFWVILGVTWCLSSVLIMKLGLALQLPPPGPWLLVIWLTVNPFMLYYHGHLMTEPLAICLVLAGALAGIHLLQRPSLANALILAFVAALGQLTRSQLLLLPAAAWLMAFVAMPRAALRRFPVFLAAFLLMLAPWLWRMHRVGAGFTATERKLGVNLMTHNNPSVADSYDPSLLQDKDYPPGELLENLPAAERDRYLTRLAVAGIIEHPGQYAWNCWRRVGLLFSPVPNFHEASPLQTAGFIGATILFVYVPLALVSLGMVCRRPLTTPQVFLLIVLALWYVSHFLLNASVRNRLPSDPLLAALALALWLLKR